MWSSKSKLVKPTEVVNANSTPTDAMISDINGRPVLQPATSSNGILSKYPLKKSVSRPKPAAASIAPTIPSPPPPPPQTSCTTPNAKMNNNSNSPVSPKLKSPRVPAIKRGGNNRSDSSNSSLSDRPLLLTPPTKCITTETLKKSKKTSIGGKSSNPNYSEGIVDAPGSIAAARREQVAVMQVQRKMKIAHYGRAKSAKFDSCRKLTTLIHPDILINTSSNNDNIVTQDKRCSFITPYSDPIYVAYHDEEWGVPVHDDKLLFEMLVLTGAQVGSDWTSVLKKRQLFREAFSDFEVEVVSKFTDLEITTISSCYGIEVSLIRGVVNNATCILEIKKAFGSFDKYIWGFVNHKPIATNYKLKHKMPVKTSKSEAISKDMMRRGFRQVGPTIIHSFMQAVGLTNDHVTTCPRHHYLTLT